MIIYSSFTIIQKRRPNDGDGWYWYSTFRSTDGEKHTMEGIVDREEDVLEAIWKWRESAIKAEA
jgi:hypothetical protein